MGERNGSMASPSNLRDIVGGILRIPTIRTQRRMIVEAES
jgi:hypothetical protein